MAQVLDQFHAFAHGLDHPEGIAVAADGALYAGGEAGQVYRVGLEGLVEVVARTGGFVLGLAVDARGRVYACDLERHAVIRIDAEDGTVEAYSSGTTAEPMRVPNHPVFDVLGNLYVTDSGTFDADDGRVYRIRAGGATEVWSREPTNFPNGCCLSLDDEALLVVTSTPEPGVSRIPIRADGSAGPVEQVLALPGTVPDGVALAADGEILVSCYRPDRIYRIREGNEPRVLADDPRGTLLSAPTNIAFAGPRLDRLVVSSLGRWHLSIGDVGIVGRALHHPDL